MRSPVLGTCRYADVRQEGNMKALGWRVMATAALLAMAAWILAGCGNTPLGPVQAPTASVSTGGALTSPPIVNVSPDGDVTFTQVDPNGAHRSGTTSSASTSAKIDGNKGGTLTCGRFSLVIPPGAFIGPATVTMSVSDPSVLMCDLSISPSAANKFAVPVLLTVNLSDLTIDPTTLTFYWYDTTHATWVALPSTANVTGGTLTTSLSHFSKYATGKAGW
jgi:hypothetical protein